MFSWRPFLISFSTLIVPLPGSGIITPLLYSNMALSDWSIHYRSENHQKLSLKFLIYGGCYQTKTRCIFRIEIRTNSSSITILGVPSGTVSSPSLELVKNLFWRCSTNISPLSVLIRTHSNCPDLLYVIRSVTKFLFDKFFNNLISWFWCDSVQLCFSCYARICC